MFLKGHEKDVSDEMKGFEMAFQLEKRSGELKVIWYTSMTEHCSELELGQGGEAHILYSHSTDRSLRSNRIR